MSGSNVDKTRLVNIPNTGGSGKISTGIMGLYHRKPVPIQYLKPGGEHGEVRIVRLADPEKLEKLRARNDR